MAKPIQVVIPTYGRTWAMAERQAELGDSVLFVVHATDEASLAEAKRLGADFVIDDQPPSGVNASNTGCKAVTSEWFVLSQDDIKHHPGWLEAALAKRDETGAKVIGLNDGFGRESNEHSVAWLIHKPYMDEHGLAIGYPGHAFCPEYTKNFADNELNDTAKARGVWAYAAGSMAEHMHPGIGKAQSDTTYERPEVDVSKDQALYESRRQLWLNSQS